MLNALVLVLSASAAHARPDLTVAVAAPQNLPVDTAGDVVFTVRNQGTKTAAAPSLRIQLPQTATSPSASVLGTLGALPSGCTRSGTVITCTLAQLKANRTAQVRIPIAMPWTSQDLSFSASVSTSTTESNTGNNSGSGIATLVYEDIPLAGPVTVTNTHCTGRGLTAFFECRLYPSSQSGHQAVFNADGTITIPGEPAYGGTWVQDTDDHLWFEYTELGVPVAEFEGNGVATGCFEGLMLFIPDNGYNAAYEVCP